MIITTVDEKIIVLCGKVIYTFDESNNAYRSTIEEKLRSIGALVRTVHNEIQCNRFHILLTKDVLVINGNTVYPIDYNILVDNYVFPDRIIACYKGTCWSCVGGCNLHKMNLERKWFEYVASGKKRIEGRLYDEKRRKIKIGDCLLFSSTNNEDNKLLYAVVTGLRYYSSFKEMLENEKLEKVLPGVQNIDEGVDIYYKYYSPGDEEKYGVLAIELDLL